MIQCNLQHLYTRYQKVADHHLSEPCRDNSTSTVRAQRKTSEKFTVTYGVHQEFLLFPHYSLYTMIWPSAWPWMNTNWRKKAAKKVAYLHNAYLVYSKQEDTKSGDTGD